MRAMRRARSACTAHLRCACSLANVYRTPILRFKFVVVVVVDVRVLRCRSQTDDTEERNHLLSLYAFTDILGDVLRRRQVRNKPNRVVFVCSSVDLDDDHVDVVGVGAVVRRYVGATTWRRARRLLEAVIVVVVVVVVIQLMQITFISSNSADSMMTGGVRCTSIGPAKCAVRRIWSLALHRAVAHSCSHSPPSYELCLTSSSSSSLRAIFADRMFLL
jgi:hypothetical protein